MKGERQSQLFKVPDDLIEKLRSWNNPNKAEEFLSNTLKEAICKEKGLDTFEVEICEFYEKSKPKQKKKSKPKPKTKSKTNHMVR